jgi:hypothetical protein
MCRFETPEMVVRLNHVLHIPGSYNGSTVASEVISSCSIQFLGTLYLAISGKKKALLATNNFKPF